MSQVFLTRNRIGVLWKIKARAQKHEVARPERQVLNMNDWYAFPEEPVEWLVEGLITTDDCAAANGKPKSGKSTGIRNLIAAVILGGKFLNREVSIPPGTGRVLYVHLDRKDRPHRVAKELRQLGITREASPRVCLLTEKDMPPKEA